MEPRIVNRCEITKKRYRTQLLTATGRRVLWLYGAVCAVLLLMIVAALVKGEKTMLLYELLLLALMLFMCFAYPRLQAASTHRRWYLAEFRDPVAVTSFYEEEVVFHVETVPQDLKSAYKHIWCVLEKDDMLILMLRGKGEMLLDPAGFEKGDRAKLRAFLQRKAPRAKLKF